MIRVVLVGAESTGKSTLAAELAEHYATVWVPEYGRDYTLELFAKTGDMATIEWTTADFVAIARRQNELEDAAARQANRLLICDTDALATAIWHERYMGTRAAEVEALAEGRHYDLYLLADSRVPFVQDEIRDGERFREWMTARFREVLSERGVPWTELTGTWDERRAQAIAAIDALLQSSGTQSSGTQGKPASPARDRG